MIYVLWTATSYKMARDGFAESGCFDGEGARGRENFSPGGAGIISLAFGTAGRTRQCTARFGKDEKLRRAWRRDRDLHCRSKHQLHQRLQCLLQVLRVLSNRERRRSLRAFARADRSETR